MGEAADIAMKLAMMLLSAGAVYGGIRSDLKSAHRKAEEAKDEALRANRRIDDCLRTCR